MEAITSFFDNIKQKITNPFFGTFILIWLIRNWELVYTLFNFDEGSTLETKKAFIIRYLNAKKWEAVLFNNICIAILVMLGGYILIIGTRVLVNVIEYRLMPNLNRHTVSKLVTNTEVFNEVTKERDELADKYENEKEKNRKLVASSDSQKKSYEEIILEKDNIITAERKNLEEIKKQSTKMADQINVTSQELEKQDLKIKRLEYELKESIAEETEAKRLHEGTLIINNELKEKHETIQKIFLTAFSDYDLLNEKGKKEVEKQMPASIYLPFEVLKKENIDRPFFQIADMFINSKRINETSFDAGLIEKFEVLGLVSIHGKRKNTSYTGNSVSLTQLAYLIIKLENILQTIYNRRFNFPKTQ